MGSHSSLPAPEDIQRFRGLRRTPRWVQLGATQEPRCGEEDGGPGSQVSLFLGQASFHPGGRSLVCGPDKWQARPLTRHSLSCRPQTWNCWWCRISSPRAPLSQAALLPLVVKKCWGYTNASSIGRIMLGVLLKIDFTYVLGDLRGFVT